jgi:mycothiol synthase
VASTWTVVDGLGVDEQRSVERLLALIEQRTGDEALTEAQRERLDAHLHVRHALRHDETGALTGYAVISDGATTEAEPAIGTFDLELARRLEHEPRPVSLLLRTVLPEIETRLEERGWRPERALHRLHRPLPARAPPPSGIAVHAFVPGQDDEAWVTLNNQAFAGHPSQGNMTLERLRARFKASWFDPEGLRLYFDDEVLVASCWTKVHRTSEGEVGEIYVVAVAPSAQGRGIGRFAVLEGLDFLASRGIREGELYVEESNHAAYALYVALGFTYASRIVEFRLDEPAAAR